MKMLTFADDVFIWWRDGKGIEQKLKQLEFFYNGIWTER
jgi:hypothetical protein